MKTTDVSQCFLGQSLRMPQANYILRQEFASGPSRLAKLLRGHAIITGRMTASMLVEVTPLSLQTMSS